MNSNIIFNPVSKKRVSEVVYDQIFERISNKELKPGDKLPSERELASQFGCGRPSVREALRMLQQDGLIEIDVGVNGGATIKHSVIDSAIHPVQHLFSVGVITLQDLIAYRKYNDKACMELAIENATPEDIVELTKVLKDYKDNLQDPFKIHTIDKSFHTLFAAASHNNMCLLVAKILTSFSTDLYYNVTEDQDINTVNQINETAYLNHAEILEVIKEKDYSRIERLADEAAKNFADAINRFYTADQL